MSFVVKVKDVIDGDTFSVTKNWEFREQTGDLVRPVGYDTPEQGKPEYDKMSTKLSNLIQDQEVTLSDAVGLDRDRLVCTVTFNGKNLADYFPEYKS